MMPPQKIVNPLTVSFTAVALAGALIIFLGWAPFTDNIPKR